MIRLARGVPAPWRDAVDAVHEALMLAGVAVAERDVSPEDPFGLGGIDAGELDVAVAPREEVAAAYRGDPPYTPLHALRAICRLTQPHTVLIASASVDALRDLSGTRSLAVAAGADARIVSALLACCGIATAHAEHGDAHADLVAAIVRPLGPLPTWGASLRALDVPREAAERAARELGVRTARLRAGSVAFVTRDVTTFRLTDHIAVTSAALDRDDATRVLRALDEHPHAFAMATTGFAFHPTSAWRETAVPLHVGATAYARERGYLR